MNTTLLVAFATVADQGSLSRAATVLGEGQSVLSRRIAALEGELGGRLFHRTGRGSLLTELGVRMLPHALAVLAGVSTLLDDAHAERDSPGGVVSLGVVPAMSRPLVSMLCAQLRRDYGRIRLQAIEGYSGQVEEWLATGRIDIGIFNRYGNGRVRDAELLMRSDLMLVSSRQSSVVCDGEVSLRALRGLPLAVPQSPNGLVSILRRMAASQRLVLDIAFEASTGALLQDAVAHAGCHTVVPGHLAEREYRGAQFVVRRIVKPAMRQHTWLALGTRRPASVAARIVLRLLRDLSTTRLPPGDSPGSTVQAG